MKNSVSVSMPYVGLDVGYGYTKLFAESKAVAVPSAVAPWTDFKFANLSFKKNAEDLFGIEVDGSRWMVGDLAILQSKEFIHVLDRDKFHSAETRITALGTIALAAYLFSNRRIGSGNIAELSISSGVIVGTGLPVNYYDEANINELRKLIGSYSVKLLFPYRKDGPQEVAVRFAIKDVVVVVQPYGTYYYLRKSERPDIASSTVGIIDIGFGTTDFITIENDIFNENASGSVDIAMTTVLQETIRLSGIDIDPSVLEFKHIQQVLDSGFESLVINVGGRKVDIKEYYIEAAKRVANKLANEVFKTWRGDLPDEIFITGGGGKALYTYLRTLPKLASANLVSFSEYGNVKGFYHVAVDYKQFNR